MIRLPPVNRPAYSRAEVVSDGVVHALGLGFALFAVPALIVTAARIGGDGGALLGVTVYGVALLAMLACSALYNLIPHPDWTGLLRRLDHSAIYVKIAGTYTPFALIAGQGAALIAALWAAALAGVTLKVAAPHRFRWLGLALYLGMGWAGVIAGRDVFAALPAQAFALIAIGGGLYTLGVAFYLWERLPFHNTIWHVFVLLATALLYAAVVLAVLPG
jgi:hemolysin III